MRNLKKSLSIVLTLALLVSSVFVGGITADSFKIICVLNDLLRKAGEEGVSVAV